MPGMQQATYQIHRFDVRRTPNPTARELMMETGPDGVFRRAAMGGE